MKLTTLIFLALLSMNVQADGKFAYINLKLLSEQSPQAIAANVQLKEQFGDREQEFRKLVAEIKQMENTYRKDSAIMSAEQKQKAENSISQKKRQANFDQKSLEEDVRKKSREMSQGFQLVVRDVIQAYGTKNGYDFIFTEANVAFASDAVNITEEILKELQK